jgi:CBS domain-containing protein
MTTEVVSVSPDATYKEVVEQLVRSGVSGVPVVDERGRLLGIVTEADLVSKEAYPGRRPRALALLADVLSARAHHWVTKAAGWHAADVMTTGVATCAPGEDVRAVSRRMLERGVKRMPVVDDGHLVGIVSRQDLLRTFARPDAEIAADVHRVLTEHPNRPDDHHVTCTVAEGMVTLGGDVRYAWDEPIVVAMVREVEGVIDVESHIHFREPNPGPPAPTWMFGVR